MAFLLHKPRGVVCSTVDNCPPKSGPRQTVYDIAREYGLPDGFHPVGRLDTDTCGLLLFTDDFSLSQYLCQPQNKTKTYRLQLLSPKPMDNDFDPTPILESFQQPLTIHRGGHTWDCRGAKVSFVRRWRDPNRDLGNQQMGWIIELMIEIDEGKHHQIRRLAKRAGFPHIVELRRDRFSHLDIQSVPNPGDGRFLTDDELFLLRPHQ